MAALVTRSTSDNSADSSSRIPWLTRGAGTYRFTDGITANGLETWGCTDSVLPAPWRSLDTGKNAMTGQDEGPPPRALRGGGRAPDFQWRASAQEVRSASGPVRKVEVQWAKCELCPGGLFGERSRCRSCWRRAGCSEGKAQAAKIPTKELT